jgi:hypothetical protein
VVQKPAKVGRNVIVVVADFKSSLDGERMAF